MLEEASRDNLEFLKEKALKAIAQLLLTKPEQEARLLSALVNKLGDPSRKLASKVHSRDRCPVSVCHRDEMLCGTCDPISFLFDRRLASLSMPM